MKSVLSLVRIRENYLINEQVAVEALLSQISLASKQQDEIERQAKHLIQVARKAAEKPDMADAMLHKYKLTSKEGLALMCLSEALLRIPDKKTADELIKDRLTNTNWGAHFERQDSLAVSASTVALSLTRTILKKSENSSKVGNFFKSVLEKTSDPFIQQGIKQAMKILAEKFVVGQTIEEAVKNGKAREERGYLHSYDMLGEEAYTQADAEKYFTAYANAIEAVGQSAGDRGVINSSGISVKLSALHPRYDFKNMDRVMDELVPKLKELVHLAKQYNIGLSMDAEESYRLDPSLHVYQEILSDSSLKDWSGFGFVVQAYQKRAVSVIDHLQELAHAVNKRLPVRLVKGAYWDSEIKLAQELGLQDYPVFTRKASTDVSYVVCAQKLLGDPAAFYPQFATHNALTVATLQTLGKGRQFEFQRLHGMGESLYDSLALQRSDDIKYRIYAPVGTHKDLLPYLVRRLLENGANSSFVNQFADPSVPYENLVQDPIERVREFSSKRHPNIPLPQDIFGEERVNSKGLNLEDTTVLNPILESFKTFGKSLAKEPLEGVSVCPFDVKKAVGIVPHLTALEADQAVEVAHKAFASWGRIDVEERARYLEKTADLFEKNTQKFLNLCVFEAGKTLDDTMAEIREAVDFCRYYAVQARKLMSAPLAMAGVTGEENTLQLLGRGVFVCISPWNFPLAIFTGQVVAALVSGNTVLAKPAGQTPLIGKLAVDLMHQAGIPEDVLQLVPGSGREVGDALVSHPLVRGVAFTGSTETARHINRRLAEKEGPIVPLIAETGGQNCMIVDSSALPEQVVRDVIRSSFQSAGQRCSALRVLYLQEDIADRVIELLKGRMEELVIGDPSLHKTDVGPVIDKAAQKTLQAHQERMRKETHVIYECSLRKDISEKGTFVAPSAYEIPHINVLEGEVFGPILHVIRYAKKNFQSVIDQINSTGFGLTFGLHTRIQSEFSAVFNQIQAGNVYINRNMIGAAVGCQPFGGEGLSGTGPKAGGPHYLLRFVTERTLSINTTAQGGNASLMAMSD